MRFETRIAGAAVVAAAVAGCAGSNTNTLGTTNAYGGDTLGMPQSAQQQQVNNATQAVKMGDAPQIIQGENRLGFNLFSKLAKSDSGKNICVSPASVGSVLSILYNGAAGDTRKQIGQALDFGKLSQDQINEANKNLQSILTNLDPQKVDLSIANSVWVDSNTPLSTNFVQKDQQYYTAKVTSIDFKAPESPATINDWVKSSTHGKIPTIVETIPSDARLYAVNAVYFNGTWQKPFDKNKTQNQTFTTADGTLVQTPMMTETGSFGYFTATDASGVIMPYGSGRLEMDIILPSGGEDLATLEKKLTPALYSSWMKAQKQTSIQITIPTFKFDFESKLNDALQALGLDAAFDRNKADFSNMLDKSAGASEKLYLSEVRHKTYIEVNERGTEAAAVSNGTVSALAAVLPGVRFTADHPFMYVIRDSVTGSIVFIGDVLDPRADAEDASRKKMAAQGATPAPSGSNAGN